MSGFYFAALHAYVSALSVEHWINDGLMAVFFLLVGLEIKREMLDGQLSTWSRRMLPGIAALGGMAVPALIYRRVQLRQSGDACRGWAIPTATDIAFALGVLSLLGIAGAGIAEDLPDGARDHRRPRRGRHHRAVLHRRPVGARAGLAALAVLPALIALEPLRRRDAWPYLVLGVVLWVLVLESGVHATLGGRGLGADDPAAARTGQRRTTRHSPLHRLEHALHPWVALRDGADVRLRQCRRVASPG